MNRLPELDPVKLEKCFVAGGAVLSTVTKTEINDYDIYPKTAEAVVDVCTALLDSNCFVVNVTDRAFTFVCNDLLKDNGERMTLQVMRFGPYQTAEDIFALFDFTICMGAYDCDTKQYTFHPDFWLDVAARNLRFNVNTRYPLNSLIRLSKYTKKGYTAGKGELAKVALAVARKGLPTSWEQLEAQLGGIYGRSMKLHFGEDRPEFSFDAAVEALSDMPIDLVNSEDFSWVGVDEIETIVAGIPITTVTINNQPFGYNLEKKELFEIRQQLLDAVGENPCTPNVDEVVVWKALKPVTGQDGVYKGAVYHGDHNGVTYRVGEISEFDKSPYLFAYTDKKYAFSAVGTNGVVITKAIVKLEDIKTVDPKKISCTKMRIDSILDYKVSNTPVGLAFNFI